MNRKYKMLFLSLLLTTGAMANTSCSTEKKSESVSVEENPLPVVAGSEDNKKTNTNSSSATVVHLTESEFLSKVYDYKSNPDKWVYKGNKPAIVDFYADWCGPCRMLSPILQRLAAKYNDRIVIYKVNTDKEPNLAAAFGITSLPTLLFIPMNESPQVAMGALPENELVKAIEDILLKQKKAN